jgi:uncharacterized membrane protein YhiD involved in acid resistance
MFGIWTDSLDHLVHLLVAFVLALPIGWNRASVERGAGFRTFPLVAMASCGLAQTAISVLGPGVPIKQISYGHHHGRRFHRCGRNHQTRR